MNTMNTMELDGTTAVIQYNPETDEFRGAVQGSNGGADSADRCAEAAGPESFDARLARSA